MLTETENKPKKFPATARQNRVSLPQVCELWYIKTKGGKGNRKPLKNILQGLLVSKDTNMLSINISILHKLLLLFMTTFINQFNNIHSTCKSAYRHSNSCAIGRNARFAEHF